jgi:hypothetical protein
VLSAQNVSHVSIDAARARIDCAATLRVSTDGPLKVTLSDCPGSGSTTRRFG